MRDHSSDYYPRNYNPTRYARTIAAHIALWLILLATVLAGFWLGYVTRPLICLDSAPHTFCN